jgi:hypothetical protein
LSFDRASRLRQPERDDWTERREDKPKWLSTKNIVKKKRRKPQTSHDKAVATNQNSHQTSGKNQNREYFTVFLGGFSREFQRWTSDFSRRFKLKGITREEFCPTPN